jgi:hypothetical protein
MAMYEEGVQTYTAMFEGLAGATRRFMAAVGDGEPTMSYVALFEALNWAVVLDERTASTWAPHGKVLGWDWRAEVEGAGILRGIRFARNSMQHDWSDALRLGVVEGAGSGDFREWTWRPVAQLPSRGRREPAGESVYAEELSGRMVRSTLVGLNAGFDLLRGLLEPRLRCGGP